jgi:DNA-binding NarL/FixJ family response regulator
MNKRTSVVVLHPRNLLGDLIQTALKADESVHIAACLESTRQFERDEIPASAEVLLFGADWCGSISERLQLMRHVRSLVPHAKPIIISGQLDRQTVLAAFSGGARGVLNSNTCGLEQLCQCVSKVAEGQIWANQTQLNWIVSALSERDLAVRLAETGLSQRQIVEWQLTPREADIVKRLIEGVTNRKIAQDLSLSENTVKRNLLHVFVKTGVSCRSELMLRVLSPSETVQ